MPYLLPIGNFFVRRIFYFANNRTTIKRPQLFSTRQLGTVLICSQSVWSIVFQSRLFFNIKKAVFCDNHISDFSFSKANFFSHNFAARHNFNGWTKCEQVWHRNDVWIDWAKKKSAFWNILRYRKIFDCVGFSEQRVHPTSRFLNPNHLIQFKKKDNLLHFTALFFSS